jgi:RND family efflux transporter MFP subunit
MRDALGRLLGSIPFWIVVVAIAAVVWLAAHRLEEAGAAREGAGAQEERRAVPVRAERVGRGPLRDWVYAKGTARAVRREYLSFEEAGKVTFVTECPDGHPIRAGDVVHGPAPTEGKPRGDLLAHLDDRDHRQEIEVARASVKEAEENARVAEAEAKRAAARKNVAESKWREAKARRAAVQSERVRQEKLFKKGVISESDIEAYRKRAEEAQASMDAAQAQIADAEAAVQAAAARVTAAASSIAAAQARLTQAEVALDRIRIFAPFTGVLAYVNVREGRIFSPTQVQTTSEDALLQSVPMVLLDTRQFEITLEVPSFEGARVETGQPAYILLPQELTEQATVGRTPESSLLAASVRGSVYSVNPAASPGGRAIEVKVRTTQGAERLHDGMFVTCWIVAERKDDAIVAPYSVFVHRGHTQHVFVVDEESSTVRKHQVATGIYGIHGVEITDGVAAGSLLVSDGRHVLVDGAPVEVVDSAAPEREGK